MPRPAAIAALALLTLAAAGGVVFLVSSGGPDRGMRGGAPVGAPAGTGSPPSAGASATQPIAHAASPTTGASARPAPEPEPAPASPTSTSTSVQVKIDDAAFGPLATRLRLRPEQTERVKVIFHEGREEIARRLERYRAEGGAPEGFTRILEEGQARIKAGVRGVLDPDQLPLLEKLEAEEAAKEAAKAPPGG